MTPLAPAKLCKCGSLRTPRYAYCLACARAYRKEYYIKNLAHMREINRLKAARRRAAKKAEFRARYG